MLKLFLCVLLALAVADSCMGVDMDTCRDNDCCIWTKANQVQKCKPQGWKPDEGQEGSLYCPSERRLLTQLSDCKSSYSAGECKLNAANCCWMGTTTVGVPDKCKPKGWTKTNWSIIGTC